MWQEAEGSPKWGPYKTETQFFQGDPCVRFFQKRKKAEQWADHEWKTRSKSYPWGIRMVAVFQNDPKYPAKWYEIYKRRISVK